MDNKYCCEDMRIAIAKWGGIEWDKENKRWTIEKHYGDWTFIEPLFNCPWCGEKLPRK